MKRLMMLSGLLVGAALLSPAGLMAQDHRDKRYYDRDGHDYHVYNDKEDRAYRMYLEENHRPYREFRKIKPAEQQSYFAWRHGHSDGVLFKVEVR